MLLNSLRWIQLTVAIATTVALGLGLILPGAMGILAIPFGLIYVLWAVRTIINGRLSMWLALSCTLAVALSLGGFGAARAFYAFQARGADLTVAPPIALAENGDVAILDTLPAEALSKLKRRQVTINRREMIEVTLILLIATGAWAVVLLHALKWRWMISGRTFKTH